MTDRQIDDLYMAFDLIRAVFADIRDKRGYKKIASRLDTILWKLENTLHEI